MHVRQKSIKLIKFFILFWNDTVLWKKLCLQFLNEKTSNLLKNSKNLSIFQFLNALFFYSCKYEQLFSSSKVSRHIGQKLHQSVRRIGSECSYYVHNTIKRLFLVLKIAIFGPHLFAKVQKCALKILKLIWRDDSTTTKS